MMERIGLAAALGVTLLAGASAAQNDHPVSLTGYLGPDAIDGTALLGPPPKPGGLVDRNDHAIFARTRKLQGTPRWALAISDNDLRTGVLKRFSCAVGATLDRTSTPALIKLLYRIEFDVRTVGTPPKDHYDRLRPPIGNTRPICVPRAAWMKQNASYPSGHSMIGWSWGMVLSELAPDRTETLMESGRDFGQSRVICGVHFQSDVEAGRMLAAAMVAREHAEPDFQADLAAARAELSAARAKGPPQDCGAYEAH